MFQDTISQRCHKDRGKKTDSNIFVEEPDTFIIPGQPVQQILCESQPTEKPVKSLPHIPSELKENIEDTSDKPFHPPPIPPKTYVKIQPQQTHKSYCKVSTSGYVRVKKTVQEVVVQVEPRQHVKQREKGVWFHSNVKFPNEVEPPPLPKRDDIDVHPGSVNRDVSSETSPPDSSASIQGLTQSREELEATQAEGMESTPADEGGGGGGEFEVAIVTEEGVTIGEMTSGTSYDPVPDCGEIKKHCEGTSENISLSDSQNITTVTHPCFTSESVELLSTQ